MDVLVDERVDAIVHFAAESHVDRSILHLRLPSIPNVRGTANLLEAARAARVARLLHVSTDEVYRDIDEPLEADETFPLKPSSPYAASKASSDLLALAYVRTNRLPVIVMRASNNYGPYQFPEKLIPLMIANALDGTALPVYGDGLQVRDWLYVGDHCRALLAVLRYGRDGEIYNVGGACALSTIEVVRRVLEIVGAPDTLITRVADRPGHDRRYALLGDKVARETGFVPEVSFEEGLARTIQWSRRMSNGREESGPVSIATTTRRTTLGAAPPEAQTSNPRQLSTTARTTSSCGRTTGPKSMPNNVIAAWQAVRACQNFHV